MEEKFKNLVDELKKMQALSLMISEGAIQYNVRQKWEYQAKAFSKAAQMITDILNSDNPNSVSNQPTEE